MVWSTGGLTRFDPKTEKFTHIAEVPNAYGIALDKDSNVWFAELRARRPHRQGRRQDAQGDEVSAADADRLPAPHHRRATTA